jgi:hypothetical protein
MVSIGFYRQTEIELKVIGGSVWSLRLALPSLVISTYQKMDNTANRASSIPGDTALNQTNSSLSNFPADSHTFERPLLHHLYQRECHEAQGKRTLADRQAHSKQSACRNQLPTRTTVPCFDETVLTCPRTRLESHFVETHAGIPRRIRPAFVPSAAVRTTAVLPSPDCSSP